MKAKSTIGLFGPASAILLYVLFIAHKSDLGMTSTWIASELGMVSVRNIPRRLFDQCYPTVAPLLMLLVVFWAVPLWLRTLERLKREGSLPLLRKYRPLFVSHLMASYAAALVGVVLFFSVRPDHIFSPELGVLAVLAVVWITSPLWSIPAVLFTPYLLEHRHSGTTDWILIVIAFAYIAGNAMLLTHLRLKPPPVAEEHTERCIACGYDLRATPDRCPECGTIAALKA